MQIHRYSKDSKKILESSVVALGFFDGVHRGHRVLLKAARTAAEKRGLTFAVFTFLAETKDLKGSARLYSSEEKAELLRETGAEHLVFADFAELQSITADNFVKEILIEKLGTKIAVSGEDFRFGKGRSGNTELLKKLIESAGGECIFVPEERVFDKKISTSLIKELLSEGKPDLAAELLGKPYFINGMVEHGEGRGHKLGTPTVNISLHCVNTFLKFGVYHSLVRIGGKYYTGLTNIGKCPTFKEREAHAETYILDFSGELYGENVRIYLLDFLREEKKFKTKEELAAQIEIDTAKVRKESIKWQELGIN